MTTRRWAMGVVGMVLALATTGAMGAGKVMKMTQGGAPDFPPGAFSDGGHYSVADFKGKVLVLFFYESACPRCRGMVPERNKLVEKYKDKPVKFIGIEAHDPMISVMGYIQGTGLAMPVFADPLRIMEKRYGENISMENIYQFKVIGPEGSIEGFVPESIATAVNNVKWKYKDKGYDPALGRAVELLEWNQFEAGMALLNPLRKSPTKAVAESAAKLYDEVKAEGAAWNKEAEGMLAANPAGAFDLYTRVAACFPKDELATAAEEALKKLRVDPAVKEELAARQMYAQLRGAIAKATAANKGDVAGFCKNIATRYPKTPTGEKAAALAKELAG